MYVYRTAKYVRLHSTPLTRQLHTWPSWSGAPASDTVTLTRLGLAQRYATVLT